MSNTKNIKFNTIEEAIREIQNGRMVVVVDDKDRENEGDLVIAAEKITPETVNFMITHARGLVCVPMTQERLDEISLPQMVEYNRESMKTAFTISVDAHTKFVCKIWIRLLRQRGSRIPKQYSRRPICH